MSLAWSPDNKSILLASWYLEPPGIYIYNTETGALRLVAELSSPVSATWHPDGELITVFNPPGFYDTRYIRLIEVDSGTYRMTRSGNKQRINSPAIWSPDGQSLAISGHSVYVIETRLINSYVFLEELQSIVLDEELNNTYFWQTPKWSPSGSQIVVSGLNYENEEPLIILLIDPHTMLSRVLAFGEQPEWSPDGEWIAFVAFSEDTESNDIFIIRPDGSDLTQITQTESDELLPHWVTKQL
jgi:Tol biopolymer transport system component